MKTYKLQSVICYLLIFSLGFIDCKSFAMAEIILIDVYKKTAISHSRILLGDIAGIKGNDEKFIQKLRSIYIGKAPLPGRKLHINERQIRLCLKKNKIDPLSVKLHLGKKVEIARNYTLIKQKEIENIIKNFVQRDILQKYNKSRITKICVGQDLILPEGKVTYEVFSPQKIGLTGSIFVPVSFKVNGMFQKKIGVQVFLEVLSDVVVTKRPLARYAVITKDDLLLKTMNARKLSSNVITDIKSVLGKRTKKAINAKTVLKTNLVEFPPLVKRGDVVSMIIEFSGLKIRTIGKIMEKGRKGETLRVLNLDSKRVIYATVLDSKTVTVNF